MFTLLHSLTSQEYSLIQQVHGGTEEPAMKGLISGLTHEIEPCFPPVPEIQVNDDNKHDPIRFPTQDSVNRFPCGRILLASFKQINQAADMFLGALGHQEQPLQKSIQCNLFCNPR
jgi:hypothetical protein